MDFHLNSLLNLPNISIFTCFKEAGFIFLHLQLTNEGINCPNCQNYTNVVHQTSHILIRERLSLYYAPTEGTVQLRTEKDGPPNATRIFSPYETEARKSIKRSTKWTLVGPVAINSQWQAKEEAGFDLFSFRVNWKRKVVYCPRGKRSRLWKNSHDVYGKSTIHVEFSKSDCSACPVRSQCTRAPVNPRGLTFMIQADYEALAHARARQKTAEFKQEYSLRSGIEGTISQGIRGFNLRKCRYIGLAKTSLQHVLTAAAINLERIYAWLEEIPLAQTRSSHFEKMAHQHLVPCSGQACSLA